MAYGLIVRDAAGNVTLDVVDRITRAHSRYVLSVPGNSAIFIPVPGMQLDGTWVALIGSVGNMFHGVAVESGGFRVTNIFSTTYVVSVEVLRL